MFLKRNWRELTWVIFNAVMAGNAVWMAIAQPDHDKALDFWVGCVSYACFVSMGGYWTWAIFDNYEIDAREALYRDLMRLYGGQS